MLDNLNLKKIILGITASIAISGLIVGLRHQGNFEQIELLAYDFLVRLNGKSGSDPRITIVEIDNNTLQKLNRDKISDTTLKQALETITKYQPRVIGVDIIRNIPIGEGREELINYVNNIYHPLESAIKPIIFPCALPSENKPNGIAPPPIIDPYSAIGFIDLETDSQDIFGREIIRRGAISSIPVKISLESASEGIFDAKSANFVCTVPFSFSFLTALSYIQAQEIDNLNLKSNVEEIEAGADPSRQNNFDIRNFLDLSKITEGEIKFKSLIFRPLNSTAGGYRQLDPSFYQYLIDYGYSEPGKIISFTDVLEDRITPEDLKDKVVLIGYTTKPNIQQTPFGSRSGVSVHGWMVSQLLSNVLDGQPQNWTWSESVEWFWILLWGILGSIFALTIRPVAIFVSSQLFAIAILWGSCWFLFTQQGWIPLIPPILSFTISGVLIKTISPSPFFSDRLNIDSSQKMFETIKLAREKTPTDNNDAFFIGQKIGEGDRYYLQKLLGKGGMSRVYLALDKKLNDKKVAIKIMTNYYAANDQDYIKRFIGEIEKLCMLNHPNIIQIQEKGITPNIPPFYGYPFYVMEYFEGETLRELLNKKEKISKDLALKIILKVCRGMKAAHNKGIIHRDIKPGNIFLSDGDSLGELVKIIDFGIAKTIDLEAKQNSHATIGFIGTYQYASPEQIRGARVDLRTDIYSLGVLFYEILSNSHPYDPKKNYNCLTDPPIPLGEQPDCEELPVELEKIVMKCLNKSPQDRFQTINELQQALKKITLLDWL